MEIYTSYFYQIRHFPRNLVPLSTAVWDRTWYHNYIDSKHVFVDKRGVLNGCRIEPFVPGSTCEGLCHGPDECATLDPQHCAFLQTYKAQLDKLDFNDIMKRFDNLAERVAIPLGLSKDDIDFALIFYESPATPCSERWMVKRWFKEHGYPIKEWREYEEY